MKAIIRVVFILILLCLIYPTLLISKANNSIRSKIFDKEQSQTSAPFPFEITGNFIENPKNSPAVSTGYYFVSSDDPAAEPWRPQITIYDTNNHSAGWYRVSSGTHQQLPEYWAVHPEQGLGYFRNPDNINDTTDNAIAGPIPIGFKFNFNGIDYDSFYVSTNGCIALSNSRYFYNSLLSRQIKANNYGPSTCYNYMSMDWFNRSNRLGNGLADPAADNFGWQSVLGTLINGEIGGIRNPNLSPDFISRFNGTPLIAPMFCDGYLPQRRYNSNMDIGKVYFYKDSSHTKLVIYFVDFLIKDTLKTPVGNFYMNDPDSKRPDDNGYLTVDFQLILNQEDSSITITYLNFSGSLKIADKTYTAEEVFRFNSYCGVTGFARHKGFDSKIYKNDTTYKGILPWAEEYLQTTYAWAKNLETKAINFPSNLQAFKFKQWKNTLRVCDIRLSARKQKEGATDYSEEISTSSTENFEILAGHEQIGTIQPIAVVQNLSNDIQGLDGINYHLQDLKFRVRCAVLNQITRRPLYNKYVKVDSISLALKKGEAAYEKIILSKVGFDGKDFSADTMNPEYYDSKNHLKSQWNGIPPYGFVQVYFPPFEPNELFLSHIGLMKFFVMLDPADPATNKRFNDMWPFDDTLNVRFWVMRHIPNDEPFIDDLKEYHVFRDDNGQLMPVPSAYKWVSIGAAVVSGDDVSKYPLPPRGNYYCENDEVYPDFKVSSPTIKLKRPESVPIQEWGGDEIRSFPIDIYEKNNVVLSIAVQRTSKKASYDRGWSDYMLVGCEHRVVQEKWYKEVQQPDELRIEFAMPSANWRDGSGISNIPEGNWRVHPRRGTAITERNMSALSIFGGGGYMVGFLETDKDSALAPPIYSGEGIQNGLRYDFYDDGMDHSFKNYYIPIPDTFIKAKNEGAKYFRFRIKVHARNNQLTKTSIPDDDDEFFVDDINLTYFLGEDEDISVVKTTVESPYTVLPASQAIAIPVKIELSNKSPFRSGAFWMKSKIVTEKDFNDLFYLDSSWIWKGDPDDDDMVDLFKIKNQNSRDSARWLLLCDKTIYCSYKQLPYLRPGSSETVAMPNWNARLSPPGNYVIISIVIVPGGDQNPFNDTTFTKIEIKFGPYFSYHPIIDKDSLRKAKNDVEELMDVNGLGLSLRGYKMGAVSDYLYVYEVGDPGGDGGSGQFATSFFLAQEDTIFGYGAYFATKNHDPDYMSFRMYDGDTIPQNQIPGSLLETKRGWDDFEQNFKFGEFRYFLLPKPLVLKRGKYWVSIDQLGKTGIELGASAVNMGMRCTNVFYAAPQTDPDNGKEAFYPLLDKTKREKDKSGKLLNKNFAVFANGLGSGTWQPFTEIIGNPSYGHLRHDGLTPVDGITKTYSRGTWMPLLFPYFGYRTHSIYPNLLWCCMPVELINFKGKSRYGANDLTWSTATELNNYGFYIERKVDDGNWITISELIPGNGTSKIEHTYNFTDEKVKENITYYYRLKQLDLDGTQTDDDFSGIVKLVYTENGEIALLPNSPNPFTYETEIKFILPEETIVSLEIFDIFGNRINTILNDKMETGTHSIIWKGNNNSGTKVSSGTYIYRLRAGESSLSGKMIYIRE